MSLIVCSPYCVGRDIPAESWYKWSLCTTLAPCPSSVSLSCMCLSAVCLPAPNYRKAWTVTRRRTWPRSGISGPMHCPNAEITLTSSCRRSWIKKVWVVVYSFLHTSALVNVSWQRTKSCMNGSLIDWCTTECYHVSHIRFLQYQTFKMSINLFPVL